MVRDALANFVINEARGIVSSDGGEVELTKIVAASGDNQLTSRRKPAALCAR